MYVMYIIPFKYLSLYYIPLKPPMPVSPKIKASGFLFICHGCSGREGGPNTIVKILGFFRSPGFEEVKDLYYFP